MAGLLSAFATPLARAEQDSCRLRVSIAPETLTTGQGWAHVLVLGPGRAPRLVSSAGTFEDLRRDGEDTVEARYVAPRQAAPRAAVIAAVLDDGSCGMGVVRLEGPPGPARATPPAPIAVALLEPAVQLDGTRAVLAYVFAADDSGKPRRGAPPALAAGAGVVSPAEPVCPGVWRSRWKVPARRASDAVLTVSFPGGASASTTLGGELASLEVALDRDRAISGSPEPVAVTVRAWDAAHRPTDADVSLSADEGAVSPPNRVERGVYRASLTLPPRTRGSSEIGVHARSGPIQGEASLTLGPGEAAAVLIEAPDSMPCDGSSAMLLVRVADSQGNPVGGAVPAVEARHASLGAPQRVGPGKWWVSYQPRCTIDPRTDLIVARAGPASGRRLVQLATPPARLAVGPKAGVALQSAGPGFAVGVEAGAWTSLGTQQVGLVLEASYWSLTSHGTVDALGAYTDTWSYLPVSLSASWRRPLPSQLMLWAAVGGGAAQVSTSSALSAQPAVTATTWVPAASGALSLGRWAWNGLPFVEVRGTWVGDPGLPTLSGSLTSLLLQLGYRFHGW